MIKLIILALIMLTIYMPKQADEEFKFKYYTSEIEGNTVAMEQLEKSLDEIDLVHDYDESLIDNNYVETEHPEMNDLLLLALKNDKATLAYKNVPYTQKKFKKIKSKLRKNCGNILYYYRERNGLTWMSFNHDVELINTQSDNPIITVTVSVKEKLVNYNL